MAVDPTTVIRSFVFTLLIYLHEHRAILIHEDTKFARCLVVYTGRSEIVLSIYTFIVLTLCFK